MFELWTDEQIEEQRMINMQEDATYEAVLAWVEYSEETKYVTTETTL